MSDDHDAGDSGEVVQRRLDESSDALKRSDPGLFVVTVKRKSRTRVVPSAHTSSSAPSSTAQGRSEVKAMGVDEGYAKKGETNPQPKKGMREDSIGSRVVVPLGYHQRPTLRLKGEPHAKSESDPNRRGRIVPRRKAGLIHDSGNLPPIEPIAPFGVNEEPKEFFERAFRYRFFDMEVLERALTHRSMHVTAGDIGDYERLEFLGDAVLDLAMAHLLLEAHSSASEGELSKMRAALVNTTTLAAIAREINIGPLIKLSRGELASGGAERNSILADVMEAVIGAVYREAGFETALNSIRNLFGFRIVEVSPSDPKTELQEFLHALGRETPKYLLELMEGPEHSPQFVSVVEIDGEIVGRGRGNTKKLSQQKAAAEALRKLRGEKDSEEIE
jgi:ribonuclease-3